MNTESRHHVRDKDKLYFSLPRVRALQMIWEDREKVSAARGLPPLSLTDKAQLTDEERRRFKESAAGVWAFFELEALQRKRTDIEVAEGMATILQGYRHESGFLDEVSARVDELLEARL